MRYFVGLVLALALGVNHGGVWTGLVFAWFRVHLGGGRRHRGKGSQQQERNALPDPIRRMLQWSLVRKPSWIS